jgi:hypothetical protein
VNVASFRCNRCDRYLGPAEIKRLETRGVQLLLCAHCGDLVPEERSREVKPLVGELAKAVVYPFRPTTLAVSLVVTLFAGMCSLVPFLLVLGGVIGTSIRLGWLFAILRSASNGHDDVEVGATDMGTSLFDWIGPAVRFLIACFVAFLPALLANLVLGRSGALVTSALTVVGTLYLPAALIVSSQDEGWLAPLNPAPAIALMTRIPGAYLTACGMLLVLFAVAGGAMAVARAVDMQLLGTAIEAVLGYLPLVAGARLLGVLVHEKREEL